MPIPRTTISQDVKTRFSVQLAFAKFLSKIKENFYYSASILETSLPQKFPLILYRNLAKASCTENQVCTSCDTVEVLGPFVYCDLFQMFEVSGIPRLHIFQLD